MRSGLLWEDIPLGEGVQAVSSSSPWLVGRLGLLWNQHSNVNAVSGCDMLGSI